MTKIEWTDRTWNPTTGCNKISPGCKNCYALTMHKRLKGMGQRKYQRDFSAGVQSWEDELLKPLSWKNPAMVFVNSMSDLFHEDVPFEFIDAVFSVMRDVNRHTYQVLTKRAQRMYEFFQWKKEQFGVEWRPSSNVWLGVSVENQKYADERIPFLLKCPAEVRFLSCEPLLGELILWKIKEAEDTYYNCLDGTRTIGLPVHEQKTTGLAKIDWVIAGGESGKGARPMHPEWIKSLQGQCTAFGVSFFFKQWGEYHTAFALMGNGAPVFRQFDSFEQWVNKASTWVSGGVVLDRNGKQLTCGKDFMECRDNGNFPAVIMHKVGKKKAGRELDGRTWDEVPKNAMELNLKL